MRILVVAAVGITVSACASSGGYPDNPVSIEVERSIVSKYFSIAEFNRYRDEQTELRKQAIRNEIIYGRIAAYDIEFMEFQQAINRERTLTDTTGDITVLILSALGASLTPVATKTALAAATTAVAGSRTAFDKNLFYDRTLPALFAQMDANRAEILARIDLSAGEQTITYPLTKAFADLNAYREAGSLPGAIAGVTRGAGEKRLRAENAMFGARLDNLRRQGF